MKNLVITQTIFLVGAVILGLVLKIDPTSGLRELHPLFGTLAWLTGLLTIIASFKNHKAITVKTLAIVVFLSTISAAIGGRSLESSTNYELAYNQMALSGFIAVIVSIILLFKLKTTTPLKK